MNKELCFVLRTSCGGGAERVVCRLANYLCNQGYNITYAFYYDSGSFELDERVNKVAFCKSIEKNKLKRTIQELNKTRSFFKKNKFDYVLAIGYSPAIEFALATIGVSCYKKLIMSERNDPTHNVKNTLQRKLRLWAYGKSDLMVFQTNEAKSYFPYEIQKKGVVIPNPISDNLPDFVSGKRKKQIVTAGRLNSQKNLKMLINVFSKFVVMFPEYQLVIYGSGEEEHSLKEFSNKLGIAEKVSFMGFRTNVIELIVDSAMYVSTSDYEGISNSVLEALALGLPTIATDCPIGGNRLMINNGVNGLLINVGSEDDLLSAMETVASDSEFADKLSRNALLTRKTFSISSIAKQWENLFD